ncbi:hypothetical protein MBLNU459_g4519t1 [Dothideomycetes sp. NU459]
MAETTTTPQELSSLKAAATREYSLKNYVAAADLYSEATELQASLNGEMDPENADLLYLYGRCLYHVAVSKSDVLGGKVAASEEPAKKKRKTKATATEEKLAEDAVEAAVQEKEGQADKANNDGQADAKPYFQITGDENWTDSEDEGDDAMDDDAPGAEEEEDDFATAYEILDVARVLLSRKLEQLQQDSQGKGKGKETDKQESPESRHLMERLADTHDLQAEISLENERFQDAISDSRSALDLKLKLFPKESSLIAEAHFKLSLALEFASVTAVQAEGEAVEGEPKTGQVDEEQRNEAVTQMESAIESCKLRVTKEEAALADLSGDQAKEKARSIKDVKEMVGDMEQRLVDLRNPAVNLNGMSGPAGAPDASNPLGGILGSMLGETPAQQKARIDQATKGANDLSGLIRKKPAKPAQAATTAATTTAAAAAATSDGSSKRKAGDENAASQEVEKGRGKKVKFEDTPAI